ncbi:hypothetical protein CDAR_594211 [Caerostris darwini]|uniref:Uncharacterized protein n=1 Tax=Caerostris darwini TaxID=1538125 RepID=A0AAV4TTI5_9ARAC|nr:hypothetical protein CDAR_594211 [Caerostris darwini]
MPSLVCHRYLSRQTKTHYGLRTRRNKISLWNGWGEKWCFRKRVASSDSIQLQGRTRQETNVMSTEEFKVNLSHLSYFLAMFLILAARNSHGH